ncbi:M9 family metallopeptidase N-terminal domain-containing protein [Kitasatospora griseola]|uniref:M9 family metallopeptidase N-terminal domain-containing protein n=1 Tax=Kitasatospora griseola TaxID=2064 RepID=UPI000A6BF5E8
MLHVTFPADCGEVATAAPLPPYGRAPNATADHPEAPPREYRQIAQTAAHSRAVDDRADTLSGDRPVRLRGSAAPVPTPSAPGSAAPQPALGTGADDYGRDRQVPVHERAPLPLAKDAQRYDGAGKDSAPRNSTDGTGLDRNAKSLGSSAAAAAPTAACNVGDFTSRTGSALVQQIKSVDTDRINTLFALTGNDAYYAFRETQMTTVAYALRDASANDPGDNSTSVAQLITFLRAGYYVQWYNPGTVGTYGTALQTAIRSGLDAFFASAHSRDVTVGNALQLGEAVTLIDSSQENARYIYVVKRLLADYGDRYNSAQGMVEAVNNVFTVVFRGHDNAAFVSAVRSDTSLLDSLYNFAVTNNARLGGDQSELVYNADRELTRFLVDTTRQAKARPLATRSRTIARSPAAPSTSGPPSRRWSASTTPPTAPTTAPATPRTA